MRNFSAAVKFRHKFFEGLTETCTKKKDLSGAPQIGARRGKGAGKVAPLCTLLDRRRIDLPRKCHDQEDITKMDT